ncbi:MAG TPA: twin-arginine translocase subunit TatC [Leptospiraceae bacterium]|nr:twin-arginine translocase subunit TatC [Leptospiraceae bacterium]HMW07459.1 twin-arginine translocase subunit TatC [Leptospiraceae bacterium]HMX32222.1 twin-arginine translocase subunit TatC [Leptospiraceae bacterium]HMY33038.1 twin-arginine translocase subunit TatC [Leptospiraceae bacterium]HMZ63504.1 twin-arginine translocase subunit TatC [Leptospiraceae bacterium]
MTLPDKQTEEVIPNDREKYMSLGDHLEELRQRLIKCLLIVGLFTIVFMIFGSEVHSIFASPYKKVLGEKATFYQVKLMAPMLIYLKTSFILAILFSVPLLLYIIWGFISPAVDIEMERYGKLMIVFATLLFWTGLAVCWFTVFENFLRVFLVMFQPGDIDTKLPIDEYYDVFFNLHLIFGISFELPVVLILLGRIGLISSDFLLNKWRETTVILSVFSAVLSPGPDVFSMMMLFAPLLVLFFLSIIIMRIAETRKES